MREESTQLEIDYKKIGLKVGLEIHQQLKTSHKLFCNCKPDLFKDEPEVTFLRRLRPTQSELGQVDPAAYFEFQKGVRFLYEANHDTSCLVEMDEEPPHPINMEAVRVALTASLIMKANPVDEIHVMRKTVIDGSNTGGFQRTCVVALNGEIDAANKMVPIQTISLEEDAARKTGGQKRERTNRYRIDRLGIPLIEVTTAPTINTPKEAQEVAHAIGRILRDTEAVMRGLGTIRQDLNVSIPNGALIEIKGVQQLDLISRVVECEVQRQLSLININKELGNRGVKIENMIGKIVDVTNVFGQTKCKVIRKALENNSRVLAVKLPMFGGLLKRELTSAFRFGTEMADRARFWGKVGGIFHTDEMPAYEITNKEIKDLKEKVKARGDDVVVFVADQQEKAEDALKAVNERAQEALMGVPAETRVAKPDGTTRYMRPRPGAARMYPETDIPPTLITPDLIEEIRLNLPEPAKVKIKRLIEHYKLNRKLAQQIVDAGYNNLFKVIIEESGAATTTVAAFLTETLKALRREGIEVEKVKEDKIRSLFKRVGSGELAKEALPNVFVWLSKNEEKTISEAITDLDLKMLSKEELEEIVDTKISENSVTVKKLGKKSFGIIMGLVMKDVRGKADSKVVGEIIKRKIGQ